MPLTNAHNSDFNPFINIVKSLYEFYTEKLLQHYSEEETQQLVTDYISGMSDQYAIRRYMEIFVPKPLADNSNDDVLLKRIRDEIR